MKKKVHPSSSVNSSQLSSTSRHELKELKSPQFTQSQFESSQFNFSNLKLKFFVAQLAKKIKFLAPPLRKPEGTLEGWEEELKEQQTMEQKKKPDIFKRETLSEQILNRYQAVHIFSVLQGVIIILFSWIVSVSLVFKEHILVEIFYVVSGICLWQVLMKFKIAWDEREDSNIYQIQWNEDFVQPLILLLAAILMIVRYYADSQGFEYFICPLEFICLFIQWQKTGKYFDFLKVYAQHNKKRKQLRIIELFCFTLVMAHIFALVMYSMIYFCPQSEHTWIQKANLVGRPWYILYIYSFYWANTTMVTVGYGDLIPQNYSQTIVVTIIQIVGTAIFGYMINVIGITVNEIQKKNEQFQQHEATIVKLKDHYQLSRQLCYRMKSDIKKKQSEMKATPLKNNEEREFLDYIDSSLKEQFVLETNIRVIKKSIFFLTHFTVNLQNQIALKLIRCIYKPQEIINSCEGNEKQLVIINNGKVNIYFKKNHHNQEIIKLARSIKPEEGKPTLNVYGYSSLILNRKLNLKAITEQITTAYILKRSDIIESIGKSILDFQSFNELRQKMQLCVRYEQIEGPSIKDQEKHFLPNSYLLLKKLKHFHQGRNKHNRSNRRAQRYLVTLKHYQNKTMLYIPAQEKEEKEDLDIILELQDKNSKESKEKAQFKDHWLMIDQAKNFENFLKNYNLRVVAKEYETACMRKSYLDKAKSFSKKLKTTLIREIQV